VNANDSAFPFVIDGHAEPGLTKRELLAAMVMPGVLDREYFEALSAVAKKSGVSLTVALAGMAFEIADALLAESEKEKEPA
jgi:hypothetical protein